MRTQTVLGALLCACALPALAQKSAEQMLQDPTFQDSVIAVIVPNHALMSKLINKIAENRQLHEMVIQHLSRLLNEHPDDQHTHDHASHNAMSHYAGYESRDIKSLSADEVKALEAGEGMGFAMAGELNHYPGPRHVLDLKEELQLGDDQVKAVRATFDRMHANAVRIGGALIESERALDRAFASNTVGRQSLLKLTSSVEALRAKLRFEHLAAHIDTKAALRPEQIELYDRLRGYAARQ